MVSLIVLKSGLLASGSLSEIKFWDTNTSSILKTLTAQTNFFRALAVLKDYYLVGGNEDYSIVIWNMNTSTIVRTLKDHSNGVWTLTVLKNGNLASGSEDATIKIWNAI